MPPSTVRRNAFRLGRFRFVRFVGIVSLLAVCAVLGSIPPTSAAADTPGTAGLPFSNGLEFGDTVYVSGQLGLEPSTRKPPADPAAEAKLVIDGVAATLKKSGLQLDDLVSVQVFCTDLSLFDTFNKEYSARLHTPYPARAFIGAKDLLFGAHFEVMGIARRNASTQKHASQ